MLLLNKFISQDLASVSISHDIHENKNQTIEQQPDFMMQCYVFHKRETKWDYYDEKHLKELRFEAVNNLCYFEKENKSLGTVKFLIQREKNNALLQ
jgi:hypothetical protein